MTRNLAIKIHLDRKKKDLKFKNKNFQHIKSWFRMNLLRISVSIQIKKTK